jgi:hypothetical protein
VPLTLLRATEPLGDGEHYDYQLFWRATDPTTRASGYASSFGLAVKYVF